MIPPAVEVERLRILREVSIVVALLGSAVALALTGHGELGATALGGALGIAVPGFRSAPVPGVVLGLAAGAFAGALAVPA